MLKLKFNTSSEQNTNCNFNMANHMSRGDYYHAGVNSRRSMRGGSTQAERGLAAEMREMHPKTDSNNNSNFRQPSNQFHLLLNQVIHDKNTEPFALPGAMDLIKNTFDRKRWKNFNRQDNPQGVAPGADPNQGGNPATMARLESFMPTMEATAYPGPASFTAPFDPQPRIDAYRRELAALGAPREYIPLIQGEVHRELIEHAYENNITVPQSLVVYKEGVIPRLITFIEDEKARRLRAAQENVAMAAQGRMPPTYGPDMEETDLPDLAEE